MAFEFALLAFHGESLVRYRSQLVGWEAVAVGVGPFVPKGVHEPPAGALHVSRLGA